MDLDPGVGRYPAADLDALVGGVVVRHQVQLAVWVAAGHMLQERQGLLMSVPVLAESGDLPVRPWVDPPAQGCRDHPHLEPKTSCTPMREFASYRAHKFPCPVIPG